MSLERNNVWAPERNAMPSLAYNLAGNVRTAPYFQVCSCKSHQSRMMKYIFLGNLLGLPGISLPVGYDDNTNLPIGLHLCLGEV